MAQIKVGTGQTKPKAIHVFKGGVWLLKKVGYVFKNNVWTPFIKYMFSIYNSGVEGLPLVRSTFTGLGTITTNPVTKFADRIEISAYGERLNNTRSDASIVTDTMINITEYSKVLVEYSGTASSGTGECGIAVGTTKNGSFFNDYTARALGPSIFQNESRLTVELDIRSLVGSYYIRVHSYNDSNNNRNTAVYRIWLE